MTLSTPVPRGFSLHATVFSHGWSALPPFSVQRDTAGLALVCDVGSPVRIELAQQDGNLEIHLPRTTGRLSAAARTRIVALVRSCLRIDDDLTEFYAEAMKTPRYRWIPKSGAGRLLRAPTVFEDVVKMICTTNCSWALTEMMTANLCEKLGRRSPEGTAMFPAPEAIAATSERYLRKEIRAGYRSPYLLELSRRVVKNDLDLGSWRQASTPTPELFEEVRSVKGIGPYAAGNILKLIGRYDYLGIDSWCRKKFFELYKEGRMGSDRTIERHYAPFGKWRGLFFWLDVTKHWYHKQFPF